MRRLGDKASIDLQCSSTRPRLARQDKLARQDGNRRHDLHRPIGAKATFRASPPLPTACRCGRARLATCSAGLLTRPRLVLPSPRTRVRAFFATCSALPRNVLGHVLPRARLRLTTCSATFGSLRFGGLCSPPPRSTLAPHRAAPRRTARTSPRLRMALSIRRSDVHA